MYAVVCAASHFLVYLLNREFFAPKIPHGACQSTTTKITPDDPNAEVESATLRIHFPHRAQVQKGRRDRRCDLAPALRPQCRGSGRNNSTTTATIAAALNLFLATPEGAFCAPRAAGGY